MEYCTESDKQNSCEGTEWSVSVLLVYPHDRVADGEM